MIIVAIAFALLIWVWVSLHRASLRQNAYAATAISAMANDSTCDRSKNYGKEPDNSKRREISSILIRVERGVLLRHWDNLEKEGEHNHAIGE